MLMRKLGLLSAGLGALLANHAVAQHATAESKPRSGDNAAVGLQEQGKSVDPFSRLESFVGARVRLFGDDDAEGAVKSGNKEGKGEESNATPTLVPVVSRLVIDTSDGSVEAAIISTGDWVGSPDKLLLVPMSAMRRDTQVRDTTAMAGPEMILGATRGRLATLPAFDMKDVDKRGIVAVVQDALAAWEKSGKSGGDAAETHPASARRSSEPGNTATTLILAEQIRPAQVRARDGKLGTIKECFADNDCQRLRFVVVTADGTDLLLPYSALHFVHRTDGDEWLIDQPARSLRENSVEYKKPPDRLIDPSAAQRAVDAHRISKR